MKQFCFTPLTLVNCQMKLLGYFSFRQFKNRLEELDVMSFKKDVSSLVHKKK